MPDNATPPGGERPRGGRPPKLTEELIEAAGLLVIRGNFRSTVARGLSIGQRTFRRWMRMGKEHPDGLYGKFRRVVLQCEATAEERALEQVMQAGRDDPKYLCWWLERKFPQRWGRFRGELTQIRQEVLRLGKLVHGPDYQFGMGMGGTTPGGEPGPGCG
jgi:hypothetical protein